LINRGKLLVELLKQKRFAPVSIEQQTLMLFAGMRGYLDTLNTSEVAKFITELLAYIESSPIFKLHFELIRFDKYFKAVGTFPFEIMMTFFKNFVYGIKSS